MPTDIQASLQLELPRILSAATIDRFRQSAAKAVSEGPKTIVVDCSQLSEVSSTHVGLMWETYVDCQSNGIQMRLSNVSQETKTVLSVLDLAEVLMPDETLSSVERTPLVAPAAHISPDQYSDTIVLTRDEIQNGTTRFLQYLGRCGFSNTAISELRLIFYEVITNIKLHSGLPESEKVAIRISPHDDGLTLSFTDSGAPFDPTRHEIQRSPEEEARSGRVHGFGLSMIRKLADDISYARENGRTNCLRITKRWRATSWTRTQ